MVWKKSWHLKNSPTPARTLSISGLKSRVLKLPKMMVKSGLEVFILKFTEIPASANLSGQFSLSGQSFLRWAAATLKGLGEFQNKNF